jgi:3-deoxy-D-manno-octulosonic-acid transferase
LVWLHTASVGEIKAIIPLLQEWSLQKNAPSFLITTVTLTSAKIFDEAKIKNSYHQFLPVDVPAFIKRFLDHWKPDLGIFVESEIWPNLIVTASKQVPLINLNSRLSDKSFSRWQNVSSLAKFLYGKFSVLIPGTKYDLRKIEHFVTENKIKYIGNLKYAAPTPFIDTVKLAELKKSLIKRKIWLAASTHQGEEEIILNIHITLKKEYPNLITIIIPRHPDRGYVIDGFAKNKNLIAALRSEDQAISKQTDIYIANTIGEIGLFYKLADFAFIGGSLIPHGGQNMLEPVKLGCVPIVGKYTHNFRELVELMIEKNALIKINTEEELLSTIEKCFKDKKYLNQFLESGLEFTKNQDMIYDKTIKELKKYL